MLDHRVFGARSRGRVFVLEWLFGAVLGYAVMLLLLGVFVVVRGVPAGWLGLGSQKERGPP